MMPLARSVGMLSMDERHNRGRVWRLARGLAIGGLLALQLTACASSSAFSKANQAAMGGDWDTAASLYGDAVKSKPDRADYRMALERAQMAAGQLHFEKARDYEKRDQLDLALLEYRKVLEYHPSHTEARSKVPVLETILRDRAEAARPRPAIEALKDKARKSMQEPLLNARSREAIDFTSRGQLRDILVGMAGAAGITVNFDRDFQDKQYNVELKDVPFETALQQVSTANQLFYKVLGERSILIIPDNPQKRQAYEEQAVQTFYLNHADPAELMTLLNTVVRVQQAIQPVFQAGKSANTLVVRASVPMLQIIERLIEANDKPRAELLIDVEILEVDRNRAKQYGLNLSQYQIGFGFSPDGSIPGASGTSSSSGASTSSSGAFNLNTITRGVSSNDFYASVPQAVIKFLESDVTTKVIAKPQLRGTEGEQLSLNLGEEIPVPSTTFTPIAAGGTAYNPMTSFQYKQVGVNVKLKPRVTYDDDVMLDLELEVSAQGADKNIAGQNLPSFTSRKVTTKLRLRDGESNLLAGLLREDERKALTGIPGTLNLPIISRLFAGNDNSVAQTDIVMLLTPHVIRTHELTQANLTPIYIGTQQNLGLTGPPAVIGQPEVEAPVAVGSGSQPPAGAVAPGTVVPGPPGSKTVAMMPPGSSPIPGTVGVPVAPPAQQAVQPPQPVPQQVQPPTAQQTVPPPTPVPPQAQPPAAQTARPPQQGPPPVQPPVAQQQAAQPAAAVQPVAKDPAPATVTPPLTAKIFVGAPTTPMIIAGGPYTIPIALTGGSHLGTVTLSVTYDPRILKARLAQEGDFMRRGDAKVTFAYKADDKEGRVDITITRVNGMGGATGDGVLAAIIFDAVGAGQSTLSASGVATTPLGGTVPVQFVPSSVTVR